MTATAGSIRKPRKSWRSHGHIVASVDHEDCHVTVFPDDRGVRYVPPDSAGDDLSFSGAGLMTSNSCWESCRELRAAILC